MAGEPISFKMLANWDFLTFKIDVSFSIQGDHLCLGQQIVQLALSEDTVADAN